ncbi:MAG: major facilitator superfamily domain-containing protein [Benjaminiella poitrasii]|nr:MAG: major facilitator superfamily domain-containing protein [Benjaminiella poitrasii]
MSLDEKRISSSTEDNDACNTISSNNILNQDIAKVESYLEDVKAVETYNFKEDPNNPLNWPRRKKNLCLLAISLDSFIGYFSSAVYMPAVKDIMNYFQTDLTTINATIALFLVFNAIAPLFWAPLSEKVGRRWIYIISLIIYCICTIICGISKNLGLFFTFRLLQSIFASAGQAVGGGTISDIFEPLERGKAMGLYMLGTIFGPAIAPVCGGYIDQNLGWRWIFYIKAMIGALFAITSFFFIPETLYVPNAKETPAPRNITERLQKLKFNPLNTLKLLLNPETGIACIPVSIAFGWFYFLVTILSPTFGETYHFSTGTIGLCYLASGVGNMTGAVFAGATFDKINNWLIKRNNGVYVKEFRLRPIYIGVPFVAIGSILYGWLLHARIHFMGPLVFFALYCFGITATIAATNTYLVEINQAKAASAVAVNNFTRGVCGMIFSLTSAQIRGSLGDGWSYTFSGLMTLASFVIFIPIVQKFGGKWREEREQKQKEHV